MKKILFGILLISILAITCACSQEISKADVLPRLGTYVAEKADGTIAIPSVTLKENDTFIFQYSVLSSNIPIGEYEIQGNDLILHAEKDVYYFQIDGDKLIYQAKRSKELPEFAQQDVFDGTVFILEEQSDK